MHYLMIHELIRLARRMEVVKLKIKTAEMISVDSVQGEMDQYLEIKIINTGLNTITLDQLTFSAGRGSNRRLLMTPECSFVSGRPPKLSYGQVYEIHISYKKRPNWKTNFVKAILKHGSLRTLQVCVKTTTGHTKRAKPDKKFIGSLRKIKKELETNLKE